MNKYDYRYAQPWIVKLSFAILISALTVSSPVWAQTLAPSEGVNFGVTRIDISANASAILTAGSF